MVYIILEQVEHMHMLISILQASSNPVCPKVVGPTQTPCTSHISSPPEL